MSWLDIKLLSISCSVWCGVDIYNADWLALDNITANQDITVNTHQNNGLHSLFCQLIGILVQSFRHQFTYLHSPDTSSTILDTFWLDCCSSQEWNIVGKDCEMSGGWQAGCDKAPMFLTVNISLSYTLSFSSPCHPKSSVLSQTWSIQNSKILVLWIKWCVLLIPKSLMPVTPIILDTHINFPADCCNELFSGHEAFSILVCLSLVMNS